MNLFSFCFDTCFTHVTGPSSYAAACIRSSCVYTCGSVVTTMGVCCTFINIWKKAQNTWSLLRNSFKTLFLFEIYTIKCLSNKFSDMFKVSLRVLQLFLCWVKHIFIKMLTHVNVFFQQNTKISISHIYTIFYKQVFNLNLCW